MRVLFIVVFVVDGSFDIAFSWSFFAPYFIYIKSCIINIYGLFIRYIIWVLIERENEFSGYGSPCVVFCVRANVL